MKLIRHAAILFLSLSSGFASSVLHAQTNPTTSTSPAQVTSIIGLWNFETATGTNRVGDEEIDVMSKGVISIAQKGEGVVANIAWFDERGDVMSLRQMEGSLLNGSAVFSHASTRTETSPRGKEITTEVKVVWTLQAKDNSLKGSRQVVYGNDPAKPVIGTRSASLIMPTVITTTAPVERGPSTKEERARVVQMALDGEKNPLKIQAENAVWLKKWVNDVPDINVNFGAAFDWIGRAAKSEARDVIQFQFIASMVALQIKNPAEAGKQNAYDLAGIEGALRAYETLIRLDDKYRSAKLDSAVAVRNKGELPAFLKSLSGRG